ncbi:MAG TPA: hypothetical protein VF773_00030 [Verrucomicrobiae bacterium]
MNVIITTVACSCALAGFDSTFAQARGGGAVSAGPGVGASAGVGSSAVSGSTAPSGNLARGAQASGTITPSGTLGNVGTGVTGSSTPVGPLNPGGITGIPPQTAGRTFDRSIIGGAPTDTVVDPANPQAPFRFPPTSRTLQPYATQNDLVEPTATPDTGAFAPVTVGNTVGTNFGGALTTRTPEPVAINLPPGARIATNIAGVPEIVVPAPGVVTASGSVATNGVVPPPSLIATNAVGRGPTFESSAGRSVTPGQRIPSQGGRLD